MAGDLLTVKGWDRSYVVRLVADADRAARDLVNAHGAGRPAVGRRARGDGSRATRQHTRIRHARRIDAS